MTSLNLNQILDPLPLLTFFSTVVTNILTPPPLMAVLLLMNDQSFHIRFDRPRPENKRGMTKQKNVGSRPRVSLQRVELN